GHPTSWQEEDPLLEVGNGSDASNLHNAMTILKNGKTGIGTATPDTSLSVIGVSRAAFDESETNFIEMSHGGGNAFINAAGTGNIDIRHEGTNIMTIAQNQRVGIGTNSPDTDFSVIGKVRAAIQSSENEYTEIFHGGDNGYINTVGDGNLQFRHDDNTLMSLNDGGDLFINRELTLGSANTNTDYTFPAIDGVANQFLKTDGNGILNWINDDHDGTFVLDNNSATLILGGNSNAHNFVFGGNFPFPNTNYSETIFMFGDSKASFRTGILDNSDNWQKSESGMASFGAGRNVIASGDYSAVFGNLSEASGLNSFAAGANTIASGNSSTAFGSASMASGDESLATGRNAEASGNYSTAMGDQTIASGIHSIAIGLDSEASGVGSIALAGAKSNSYQCVSIGYGNDGGSDPDSWEPFDPVFEVGIITAIQNNIPIGKSAFTVLKNGDVGIMRSSPLHPLHVGTDGTNGNGAFLTTGGLWANGSSRTFKHRFEQVDKIEILEKLVKLDILKWEYKESEEGTHLGPIAEDFYETFGLGSDEKYISTADADGVALAAIQGLYQENQELKNELESQKKEINDLKELVSKLIELNSKE
ncbi:MAG: hypothetical protein HKN68_12755, partial [Saprospiraceae bacterium]|nr:hypothetical protein [Saprospiraceae bacterium]